MFKRLILLSGPIGAGKTTLSGLLAERYKLPVIRTRTLLLQLTRSEDHRDQLQRAGERLDVRSKGRWLAEALVRYAEQYGDDVELVVDSVRIDRQIEEIRAMFSVPVFHLHLTASRQTLSQRYADRRKREKRKGGFRTYAHVRANRTERDIGTLEASADVVLNTERCTIEDVFVRVASQLGYFSPNHDRLVDVLVGGQYGSEGKGNVASYLAPEYELLVRIGGPNAGHKVYLGRSREVYAFHLLPSGTFHNPKAHLVMAPGSLLWMPTLQKEIADCAVGKDRLSVDPQAMIIDQADRDFEERTLKRTIASTAQGVGAAHARKVLRHKFPKSPRVKLARDIKWLLPFIRETRRVLDDAFSAGKRVFLEGTQGTGLSLHHGRYPHVTSRDTTVSGCLADAGIAPSRVRRTVMVCRTFPIRVQNTDSGKTSGYMSNEITYEALAKRSKIPLKELKTTEKTTTTQRQRRIGEFEWLLLRTAASLNGPTDIALTFADYLSIANRTSHRFEQLTDDTIRFVEEIEGVTGAPVSLISVGFGPRAIIDRRKWW